MPATAKTFSKLALAATAALLPLAGIGCEKDEAASDRVVQQKIDESQAAALAKTPDADRQAYSLLDTAAKETQASPASRASARAMLAQADYAAAVALLPTITMNEAKAMQAIREIGRLGWQVADENFLVGSYKAGSIAAGDSAEPIKALAATTSKYAAEVGKLQAQKQDLQSKRDTKSAQIADLTTRQKTATDQAESLSAKSEQAKGQESVDLFNQSADAHENATRLANQTELAKADLARLEGLIADVEKEKKITQDIAEAAQKQIAVLKESTQAAQKAIAEREAVAKAVLDAGSITAKAKELGSFRSTADDLRKQAAEDHLAKAASGYASASEAAAQFQGTQIYDSASPPEKAAWERMKKLYNPNSFRLGEARAHQASGILYLQQKELLDAQQSAVVILAQIFAKANLPLPAELAAADVKKQVSDAAAAAKRELDAAAGLLKDIVEADDVQSGQWPQTIEARQLQMAVRYSLYRLAANKADLDDAKAQLKALFSSSENFSIVFPSLPSDLEDGVLTRATVTTAAGDATTQPAAGGGGSVWLKMLNRAGGAFKSGAGGEGGAPPAPTGAQPPPPPTNQ